MEFICQAVPNRDTGIFCQHLNALLAKTSVFNSVIHPPQYPGSILERLFTAQLASAWFQVGDMRTLVICGDFEGAASPGGGLLKDQHDILAFQPWLFDACIFGSL